MTTQALILAGGWPGHAPIRQARTIEAALRRRGFEVRIERSLTVLDEPGLLSAASVVIPIWTMGRLSWDRAEALRDAVADGVGLAGFHGTADAFRAATDYQHVLGGQFVAHPGGEGVDYVVEFCADHPISNGLRQIRVRSERYYLHVDPSNTILATTVVPRSDGTGNFLMPMVWTRNFGRGRVFYSALGHTPQVLAADDVLELTVRGICWAARQGDLLRQR